MKLSLFKHRKKVTGLRKYSYYEFLVLFAACSKKHQEEILGELANAPKPNFICDKEVPKTLNMLTYGQLDDLSDAGDGRDAHAVILEVIMGLTKEQIYTMNVVDVFGFNNFVKEEVKRINALFDSIKLDHTQDEVSAGIEDLNFGSFGVLDWYARRMGITNQNEVREVAWVRIYKCMKNDNEKTAYERRLNQQLINRAKTKRK